MTICLLAIVLTVQVAQCVAWLAWRVRERRAESRSLIGKTVVVAVADGESVRGVVHGDHADQMTLVEVVLPKGPVQGVVHVPRGQIRLVQQIDPSTDS